MKTVKKSVLGRTPNRSCMQNARRPVNTLQEVRASRLRRYIPASCHNLIRATKAAHNLMTCCDAGSLRLELIELAPRRGYRGSPETGWYDTAGETLRKSHRSQTGGIKANQWEKHSYFVGPPLGYNLVVTLPQAITPWPPS